MAVVKLKGTLRVKGRIKIPGTGHKPRHSFSWANISDLRHDDRSLKNKLTVSGLNNTVQQIWGIPVPPTYSLSETVSRVKQQPRPAKTLMEYLSQTPIKTIETDTGTKVEDGHYSVFLADQLGFKRIPQQRIPSHELALKQNTVLMTMESKRLEAVNKVNSNKWMSPDTAIKNETASPIDTQIVPNTANSLNNTSLPSLDEFAVSSKYQLDWNNPAQIAAVIINEAIVYEKAVADPSMVAYIKQHKDILTVEAVKAETVKLSSKKYYSDITIKLYLDSVIG